MVKFYVDLAPSARARCSFRRNICRFSVTATYQGISRQATALARRDRDGHAEV
jgi:hypothetical protein